MAVIRALLIALVVTCAMAGHAFAQTDAPTLAKAIQWKWPGAQVVIRGTTIERWDGPMPRPSDAAIAQAVTEFAPVAEAVALDVTVTHALDTDRLTSAVVWTILKQMFPSDTDAQTKTKYSVARSRIVSAFTAQPWK